MMSEDTIDLRRLWRGVRRRWSLPALAIGGGTAALVLAVVITWAVMAARSQRAQRAGAYPAAREVADLLAAARSDARDGQFKCAAEQIGTAGDILETRNDELTEYEFNTLWHEVELTCEFVQGCILSPWPRGPGSEARRQFIREHNARVRAQEAEPEGGG